MGDKHGSQWMRALPWVLLGKRVQVQPDLDASAAMLVFGKSVSIPGQLLGHPGPPLTNLQTKALLHELYKLSAKPAIQTTSVTNPIDISVTENAEYVYVKAHEPKHGLSPRFDGPFKVVSRPSRSTVQIKVGTFADGRDTLSVFHWSSCKVANMREGAEVASRPMLGRKPTDRPDPPPSPSTNNTNNMADDAVPDSPSTKQNERAKIQNADSTDVSLSRRPARSTRNPSPQYVDSVIWSP